MDGVIQLPTLRGKVPLTNLSTVLDRFDPSEVRAALEPLPQSCHGILRDHRIQRSTTDSARIHQVGGSRFMVRDRFFQLSMQCRVVLVLG